MKGFRLCQGGVNSAPCISPLPVWPGRRAIHLYYINTDSITNRVRTNDLSKLEVRLTNLIGPISETNRVVSLSTAWSSELSDDHSKGSVMKEHFVLPVLEGGYRQEPCQGLHSVLGPE